MKAIKMMEI